MIPKADENGVKQVLLYSPLHMYIPEANTGSEKILTALKTYTPSQEVWDYPGGPVVEYAFQCRGHMLDPWSGN